MNTNSDSYQGTDVSLRAAALTAGVALALMTLIAIAGGGYFVNGFVHSLFPDVNMNFLMFTFIGEVVFLFWLLIKGPQLKDPE